MSQILYKLIIEENGKEALSKTLTYEDVERLASYYDDSVESNDFFVLAARHPAASVRENVASKDKISEAVLGLLINDKSITVLRSLVRSEAFREHASIEDIERLINIDAQIAQTVAENIESYQQADTGNLCSLIMRMEDPSIVSSLANNYSTPKKILKELMKHADPYVVKQAKKRLED